MFMNWIVTFSWKKGPNRFKKHCVYDWWWMVQGRIWYIDLLLTPYLSVSGIRDPFMGLVILTPRCVPARGSKGNSENAAEWMVALSLTTLCHRHHERLFRTYQIRFREVVTFSGCPPQICHPSKTCALYVIFEFFRKRDETKFKGKTQQLKAAK